MRFLFGRRPANPPAGADRLALQSEAEHGSADAQFQLGLHYSNLQNDARDFPEAIRWYLQAAEQGHALAQFNLGVMFSLGQGVDRDSAAATDWMRRAAEGGDAGGQYRLGMHYHRASLGSHHAEATESRVEAFKWLHLSAEQGYGDSRTACERINLTMSREELNEGRHRAAAFVGKEPSNGE